MNGGLLTRIESNAFKDCTAVTSLELSGNDIDTISSFAFTGLSSLTSLDLDDIGIHVIKAYAFDGMASLKTLILSHNNIVKIELRTFNNLPLLDTLDLSGNPLSIIEPNSIDTSSVLQNLIIDETNLIDLDHCIFGSNTPTNVSITTLDSPLACDNANLCWIVDGVNAGWIRSTNGSTTCMEGENSTSIVDALNCTGTYTCSYTGWTRLIRSYT